MDMEMDDTGIVDTSFMEGDDMNGIIIDEEDFKTTIKDHNNDDNDNDEEEDEAEFIKALMGVVRTPPTQALMDLALKEFSTVSDTESSAGAVDADGNNTVSTDGEGTTVTTQQLTLTGRPGTPLYLSCNPDYLSDYQCLLRKTIELFEANEMDINSRIKGRNKPIVLGQVGIRCCHCAYVLPIERRGKGSMYFPGSLLGIYQAAQTLAQQHLLPDNPTVCPNVPSDIRARLKELKTKTHSSATAGKEYWALTAKVLGVFQDQYGLRFEQRLGMVRMKGRHIDLIAINRH